MRAKRSVVAVLFLAVLGGPSASARAQSTASGGTETTPPRYAVLSLIGDAFTVVMRRGETSTRVTPNESYAYPIAEAVFDKSATAAAQEAIVRARPSAEVLQFAIRDARLFALQERLTVESAESTAMREALAKLIRDNQATHLVLITKRRDDASFKLADGTTGVGKLAGLGFYVDPTRTLHNVSTGAYSNGYFASYAYMDVALIEAASMRVMRSVPALESALTVDTAASGTFRAWDALNGSQKVDALERLIRKGVATATASALAN
jgi:hypothetical protein